MPNGITGSRLFWLTALRMIIGWHFFYEGLAKLTNPNWSSAGYLLDSGGIFRDFFISLAGTPGMLQVVDFLNVYGLMAIGAGLIFGLLERTAIISGIVLLALYYLSHPPFTGIKYAVPSEGSYLIVNKILIEITALCVLFLFPTGRQTGFDGLICRKIK